MPTGNASSIALLARPTAQPPSRGQDSGECGWLTLPEDVFLSPRTSDSFARSGVLESDAGGVFATWQQDLFAWNYQTVYFNVGSKLFVKAEVIENEAVQLPGIQLQKVKDVNTIAIKDCNNVLLYILRETTKAPYTYKIFNRDDNLIATSEMGEFFTDQIHFYDDEHNPLVIAQSPKIVDGNPEPVADNAHPSLGNVPSWEVRYLHGYNSSSSLLIEEYRWVIMLAVQERAIRSADRAADGQVMPSKTFPLFIGISTVFFLVVTALLCCCFFGVYRLVYPKKNDEVENKYLRDMRLPENGPPSQQMYGSLKRLPRPWQQGVP